MSKLNTLCLSLAAIGLAVPQPSLAQVVGATPGMRGGPAGSMTPETQNRTNNTMMQREFDNRRLRDDGGARSDGASGIAKCLARRGGNGAGALLGGELAGDPDYKRIGDALTGRMQNCAVSTGGATATASAISGSLAEQLLVAQAPQLQDRAAGVSQDAARKFYGDLTGMVTIDKITGCLAVYSPGLVYKLIQSPAGSPQETAALQALYQQSPECGMATPPAQVPVASQRGLLATALYKWTHQGS